MGRVLRLDLEYDGAGFSGWADQPGLRTVEGTLSAVLAVLLREPVALVVGGRPPAGVHAPAPGASGPRGGPDARRDARGRRYEYRVLCGPPSALRRGRVLHHPTPLDVDAMNAAAELLRGTHDLRAFTPTRTEHVFFDRTLTRCEWIRRDDELVLVIEADAFLRHMVRVVVGTLLLVGRGAWAPERVRPLLAGAPRAAAGPTAPAHPLTLVGVEYERPPARTDAGREKD